jgi:hypothetical protein
MQIVSNQRTRRRLSRPGWTVLDSRCFPIAMHRG